MSFQTGSWLDAGNLKPLFLIIGMWVISIMKVSWSQITLNFLQLIRIVILIIKFLI